MASVWRRAPPASADLVWCPAPRCVPDREEVSSYLAHGCQAQGSRARLPEMDALLRAPWPSPGGRRRSRSPWGGGRSLAFALEAELSLCASPSTV